MPKKSTPAGSPLDQVRAAKAEALSVFEGLAAVVGVGITRVGEGYGLKVNLRAAPAEGVVLPAKIKGVPVRVEVVGGVKKQVAA